MWDRGGADVTCWRLEMLAVATLVTPLRLKRPRACRGGWRAGDPEEVVELPLTILVYERD